MIKIVPKLRIQKIVFSLFFVGMLFNNVQISAQVSITSTAPVTESFTGYLGTSPGPNSNWDLLGSTVFNGTNQTTGSTGGWYGSDNLSFLGINGVTNVNATWKLQNNTNYSITTFTLAFIAKMFKSGSASPNVQVYYEISSSATFPVAGTTGFTQFGSLTFSDATANISSPTGASLSQTISSINIPNGYYIYIRFIHAGGKNSDNLGWDDVTFTPVIPQVNIAAAGPAAGNIYPATTNNILQSFSVQPLFSAVTLSSLTVNTGGTYTTGDLATTPFKLYINSSNSLSGATQIGTAQAAVASGGVVSFTSLNTSIATGSAKYIIVTADLSGSATIGSTINITSTAFSNIYFSTVPVKVGTDPVSASNDQTIIAGVSLSNTGTPAASNIGQSTTDNALFGFEVTPAGSTSLTGFTSVTIDASGTVTGADMYNFKIVKDVDASGDYSGGDVVVSGSVPYSATMTFSISGETGITAATRYLLVGDVVAIPTFGRFITLSISSNANISLSNQIISAAPYSGNAQTIVNTVFNSLASDYFRSAKVNGNWTTTSTWESSTDNTTWHTATLFPTNGTTKGITIKTGTTVTIDSTITARVLVIESGAVLSHTNGKSLTIANATATFTINGTYVLNGTRPAVNASASVVINNGGIVRVDDNAAPSQSDDFARQTNVLFKTGAIFQWNKGASAFEAGGSAAGAVTYFPSSAATDKPIFRITANPGDIGGNNNVTFNGKVEVTTGNATNIRFVNLGTKYFRDGLGSPSGFSGKITNTTGCGAFIITGSSATIDGNFTFNIDDATSVTNDLEIATGASVTISGAPLIRIGTNAPGSNMVINGALLHNGTVPVEIFSGNLYINGYLDPASTGSFQAGASSTSTTLVSVGGTANTSAGALKLTTGANYINTFTINRGTSGTGGSLTMASALNTKSFVLIRGVMASDNNLVTWLNTGAGSTITYPASYSNSYICTCNSSGVEITPTGSNGFRINNVSGNTDMMFPIGTDFNSANRMALNMNNSTTDDFTVVVGKGDIGNTTGPRVNRIWYVREGTKGGTEATMKLYFTKRNYGAYPFGSAQNDEIEDGFLWSDPRFVQEDYNNDFINVATAPSSDVPDYTGTADGSEIFGLYTRGVSADPKGVTNGIDTFSRFSVVNLGNIILPVSLTNIKAYQKESGISIDWSALNETNINRYEIERSVDAFSFTKITSVNALNNGKVINNYSVIDNNPVKGNNFYRIKAIDKDGRVIYSGVLSVNVAGGNTFVMIYPNPVRNHQLNVKLNNVPAGKYQLAIYNYLGQQVSDKLIRHDGGSAAQNMILPANIKAGVYVVKVIGETVNFSSSFMVE
ncbi:T9SS type A sorting domain-containing protein [Panacibacter ginsenosidivorans]|uniref:T9SS type A sorting domain-containing protein n=1 Tax=Panacibacter ginsenosidivorans TaxID=1813871 RepID=A0A5B8VEQ0_9BACT|nr:T9SS type A sorting domain-containing protein [Panacibacter ginsenosidivorans]QEC70027.1 T9SS type A sorting domain-containing protein [Panacibacter ginsenosidivorans]